MRYTVLQEHVITSSCSCSIFKFIQAKRVFVQIAHQKYVLCLLIIALTHPTIHKLDRSTHFFIFNQNIDNDDNNDAYDNELYE